MKYTKTFYTKVAIDKALKNKNDLKFENGLIYSPIKCFETLFIFDAKG